MAEVSKMYRYPLKGAARDYVYPGKPVELEVDRFGPAMDHRFAVIDSRTNKVLDQKTQPFLALIAANFNAGNEHVQLSFRGESGGVNEGLAVPIDIEGEPINLETYGEFIPACRIDFPKLQELLNKFLDTDGNLEIVRFDESRGEKRGVDPDFANLIGDYGRAAFHSGSPFHIVGQQSADAISERAEAAGLLPVDTLRWRPTLIVDTDKPFEEDSWVGKRIKIGDVILRVYRKAPRCPIPGINQLTAVRDIDTRDLYKAIDRNLPAEHSGKIKPMVGVYATHENAGEIRQQDEVQVLGDII